MDTLKRAYVQYYWDKRDILEGRSDMLNHDILIAALVAKDPDAACSALGKDLKEFAY